MATAIYVPCLAISAATGGRIPLTETVFVLGCIVTLYTALGGVQAVIWNDVIQFCVRFGGLTAVVAIAAASVPGGLGEIWRVADAAGKTTIIAPIAGSSGGVLAHVQAFFEQPLNIVAIMFALLVGRMAAYVGDQIMVQRLQTTKSLQDARKAFIVNAAGDIIWMFALSFVGLALFAYFQLHTLPPDFSTDKILPYFMSLTFPRGIVGLVIASIMASSLSSVDSAINSCTSVVVVDFYNRLWLRPADRARAIERRAAARGGGVARRDGRLRRGGHAPGDQRVADRQPAGNRQQADQRVHRPAVRHLPARDVQPPRHRDADAGRRRGRIADELLRRVPHLDRVHVAVDVRAGGDADRRRGDDRRQRRRGRRPRRCA